MYETKIKKQNHKSKNFQQNLTRKIKAFGRLLKRINVLRYGLNSAKSFRATTSVKKTLKKLAPPALSETTSPIYTVLTARMYNAAFIRSVCRSLSDRIFETRLLLEIALSSCPPLFQEKHSSQIGLFGDDAKKQTLNSIKIQRTV